MSSSQDNCDNKHTDTTNSKSDKKNKVKSDHEDFDDSIEIDSIPMEDLQESDDRDSEVNETTWGSTSDSSSDNPLNSKDSKENPKESEENPKDPKINSKSNNSDDPLKEFWKSYELSTSTPETESLPKKFSDDDSSEDEVYDFFDICFNNLKMYTQKKVMADGKISFYKDKKIKLSVLLSACLRGSSTPRQKIEHVEEVLVKSATETPAIFSAQYPSYASIEIIVADYMNTLMSEKQEEFVKNLANRLHKDKKFITRKFICCCNKVIEFVTNETYELIYASLNEFYDYKNEIIQALTLNATYDEIYKHLWTRVTLGL
jgi:dGTP triphosphohydrolase